jgi:HAD superfamily phosphatase (TIGR01668 family)
MKFTFVPDYVFNTFDEATPDFLEKIGVRALVLDIDNTLEPYENPVPTERVLNWFNSLWARGIKTAIVSNNNKKRVEGFAKELGVIAYASAKKPFPKYVKRAMSEMGVSPMETAFIGDQIFTDVWVARNAKIKAILVPPIKDKKDPLTRFKRILERPFLKKYEKRNNR